MIDAAPLLGRGAECARARGSGFPMGCSTGRTTPLSGCGMPMGGGVGRGGLKVGLTERRTARGGVGGCGRETSARDATAAVRGG